MKKKAIVYAIVNVLLSGPVCAQFIGGEGAGTNSKEIALLDCNFFTRGGVGAGVATIVQPRDVTCNSFFGNDGSGYLNLELKREMECNMYMGDSVSGYKQESFKRVMECNMYMGETHSGANMFLFENPFKCIMYTASLNAGSGFHMRALSQDTLVCEVIPLGIDCSPLLGEIIVGNGVLSWFTETEHRNSGFEVFRSLDGYNWKKIAWVSGEGTSYERKYYQYVDKNLSHDGQYYQFKQLDFDGNLYSSNIVYLKADIGTVDNEKYTVFPNPSLPGNILTLKSWNSVNRVMNIEIIDGVGRLVWSVKHHFSYENNSVCIPAGMLNAGSYYMKLTSETDQLEETLPFVIFN